MMTSALIPLAIDPLSSHTVYQVPSDSHLAFLASEEAMCMLPDTWQTHCSKPEAGCACRLS